MAMDDFPDSDFGEEYVIQLSKEQWQGNQFVLLISHRTYVLRGRPIG